MHPRTLVIVLSVVLLGSFAVRYSAVHFAWWPTSEQSLLKRAKAISVRYWDQGQQKTHTISDPVEVRELLACLHAWEDDSSYRHIYGGIMQDTLKPALIFRFPGGETREYTLTAPYRLGHLRVDQAFTDKLTEFVSRQAGHKVNFFTESGKSYEK